MAKLEINTAADSISAIRGHCSFLIAGLTLALAGSVDARIGENQTQHGIRYGFPVGDTSDTLLVTVGRVDKKYEHDGWRLRVTSFNNRAVRIDYYSPDFRRLTDSDLQAILRAETGGGAWLTKDRRLWVNSAGWRAYKGNAPWHFILEDPRGVAKTEPPKPKQPVPHF